MPDAILFFDTETTGLPDDRLPIDHDQQPHLAQIAAQLRKPDGAIIGAFSLIVDPGVPIPEGASNIHGVTTEIAQKFGVKNQTAAGMFAHFCRRASLIVAHNSKFDVGVMSTAMARAGVDAVHVEMPTYCTMEAASPIVNLPPTDRMKAAGFDKPKPPKLEECIDHFFGEALEGAHNALIDVEACARLYFHLKTLEPANA